MFYPTTQSEIKLSYHVYTENNSKPKDAILLTVDGDQRFGQDVIDDLVGKGIWNETLETQLENKQLYFKVFRDDEDMIPVDAVMFDNVRMLPNRGLLDLDEPLQNAISQSATWLGSFIPESVKQSAYDFGSSLAQWTEDKLTGLSAYSSIPKVKELDKDVWQERVEEGATESELLHYRHCEESVGRRGNHNDTEENTDQTITTTSTSYLRSLLTIAWNAYTYAANNPLKTLVLLLAASSFANRSHLPKMKFESPSLDFTNGISTATNILTKLAVAKMATNGFSNTPMNAMIAGISLWGGVGATGSEFLINTYTTNTQASPRVASLSDGSFVVAWESYGQDALSAWGVYAQRFNGTTGAKLGIEFPVNTYTTNSQGSPSIVSLPDDTFVVAWKSASQDGSNSGIYAQRFNRTGGKLGFEFPVNTYTTNIQDFPSIASLPNGNFVVTWQGEGQDDPSGTGVYGQRFNDVGAKVGSEFLVNTYITNNQYSPSVVSLPDSSFVVVWTGVGQEDPDGIYGQRFNGTGAKLGVEFLANTYTTNNQYYPSVKCLRDGSFVVAWQSIGQDSLTTGLYGQRFNVAGVKLGVEFQINTYTTNDQIRLSIASLPDGSFVVVWESNGQDASMWGVYGQRFTGTGMKIGVEFPVNSYTTNSQQGPSVASLPDGSFIVVWYDEGQGDVMGSYGRLFTPPRLENNTLILNQGQTRLLTGTILSASAPNTPSNALIFTLSNIQYGHFEFISGPGVPIVSFSQLQVNNGQIQFIHNGGELPPSYFVKVSEAVLDTTFTPATVIFNVPPLLVKNTLAITQGQTVTLTVRELEAIDPDNTDGQLVFNARNIQFGFFDRISIPDISITSFTQQDIKNAQIRFKHFGGPTAPTYQMSVSDGQLSTAPTTVSVNFNGISFPPVGAGEDNTIRNALIAAGVSALVGFIAFALKYGIRRASNKKLQTALAAKENELEKQQRQYDDRVIKPIASHIHANIKIAASFESVSTAKVNNFIMAVQTLASEMNKAGIRYEDLSEAERNTVHRTIVKELKYIAHPNDTNCCTSLMRCGFFKADVTPQQIEENAEKLVKAINKALNRTQFNVMARVTDPKHTQQDMVAQSIELKPITATDTDATSSKSEAPRISAILPKLAKAEEEATRAKEKTAHLEAEMADMKKQMAQLLSAQTGSPVHTSAPTAIADNSVVEANVPPQALRPVHPVSPRL